MGQNQSSPVTIFVNGRNIPYDATKVDPSTTVATWLREQGLVGTKIGCGKGACGACTIMISRKDGDGNVVHYSANACLMPLVAADLCHITTIEGSGSILQRCKERFAVGHAAQCGFCTPGFVMSIYAALRSHPDITPEELMSSLDGNLCRCTGYRPIMDAAASLCPCGKESGECCETKETSSSSSSPPPQEELRDEGEYIFPPYLQTHVVAATMVQGTHCSYARPISLETVQRVLDEYKDKAHFLGGGTSSFVQKLAPGSCLISLRHLPDMQNISFQDGRLTMGAAVTLSETLQFLQANRESYLPHSPCGALETLLRQVGSTQVRNTATWGGACALAEPDSDLLAYLSATDAEIQIIGKRKRTIKVAQLVKGPWKTTLTPGVDIVASISIPAHVPMSFVQSFKFNARPQLSRSVVGGTCVVRVNVAGNVVALSASLIGVKDVVTSFVLDSLVGASWTVSGSLDKLRAFARERLFGEIDKNEHKLYSAPYRKHLCDALLFEFLSSSSLLFSPQQSKTEVPPFRSSPVVHTLVSSSQTFEEDPSYAPVGKPLVNYAAPLHVTGSATYTDDEGLPLGGLYCVPILSRSAHAKFTVDDKDARAMPGVVEILYAKDILERPNARNVLSPEVGLFFADGECHFWGQALGLVVAQSHDQALRASYAVKVEYENLPAVNTLEDAIRDKAFHPYAESDVPKSIYTHGGDVDDAFHACPGGIFESSFRLAAAEHAYLEPHSCTVVPRENATEFIVTSSTQSIAIANQDVSAITGVDTSRITVQTKRLGGGFGGKGITALALPALAAAKLNKPCRMTLVRSHDMLLSTKRGETLVSWRVGVDAAGLIHALDVKIYYGSGYYRNGTNLIPGLMMLAGMGSYEIPNYRSQAFCARLNRAPTGPFRGAGIPQGCAILEMVMERTAAALKVDPDEFRLRHMRKAGATHLHCNVPGPILQNDVYEEVLKMVNYAQRKADVAEFNKNSRWTKRGIALQLYGHPLGPKNGKTLHQGRACIHVAGDGSVTVSHQGIEMGQGVHQKMLQLVSYELHVPLDRVRIATNSSDVLGHTAMDTGGSVGTEVNAAAISKACRKIKKNARKICAKFKLDPEEHSVLDVAPLAVEAKIPLSAWAMADTYEPDEKVLPESFKYWVWGCAVAEVQVDLCTGSYQVTHVSACLDVGRSFNPAIDIGQLEGGLVQGISWCTREQIQYSPTTGAMLNPGFETYLIATPDCIPREFHVKLLPRSENVVNKDIAFGCKGVGEPPKSLGLSVLIALQRAVNAGRAAPAWLNLPATHQRVREAIGDISK